MYITLIQLVDFRLRRICVVYVYITRKIISLSQSNYILKTLFMKINSTSLPILLNKFDRYRFTKFIITIISECFKLYASQTNFRFKRSVSRLVHCIVFFD